ncbi:MAG: hypothetical protein V2A65_03205 [Candidatus Omnitrophota bacterium]
MVERLRSEQNIPDLDFAGFFRHDVRYVYITLPECPKGISSREWRPLPDARDIAACGEQVKALQDRGLAVCGGYIAAPCHTLTEEVPWESVLAFHQAVQRYETYKK